MPSDTQLSEPNKKQAKREAGRLAASILSRIEQIKIRHAKISAEFPVQITTRGSSYYVRVPIELINYYNLVCGDWIKFRATEFSLIEMR